MFIKNISLHNFRIYHGIQSIFFAPDTTKNVFVISGNNGYGKTSFLTSLVWCLYGKNMQEVDDTYRTAILEAGGYKKHMRSCLNLAASVAGNKSFQVEITFSDVSVPGISCNEIRIVRLYNTANDIETLEIYIDGQENELVQEVGKEIFIHDFILPKEIAKFFFFDAEKNVRLAEAQSLTDKLNLSKAYSEILGIKKYEELKANLTDLRLRYSKGSAEQLDLVKINGLEKEIHDLERLRMVGQERMADLEEQKQELKHKIDKLQEKLIREGSTLSVEQVKDMHARKKTLAKQYEVLKTQFNELLELAPFAIAGSLMAQTETQLKQEEEGLKGLLSREIVDEKIESLRKELKRAINKEKIVEQSIKMKYEGLVTALLRKYFVDTNETSQVDDKIQHQIGKENWNHFKAIMENLRSSYRMRLAEVNRAMKNNRYEFNKLLKLLTDAEARETDKIIQTFRIEKIETEQKLQTIENLVYEELKALGSYENQYASRKKVLEEVSKKVQLFEKYKAKDELAERLIFGLTTFLDGIRGEKRHNLEVRILTNLQALMHKQRFITRVQVTVENEMLGIELYHHKERILKENLSKGEQQLYVTALLKALVEESNIQFPVFIDSPMQKYDAIHAAKVITEFYPTISSQVVIFPLLRKEMTEEEYSLLVPHTKAVYAIENNGTGSSFREISVDKLFTTTNSYVKAYA